MPYAMLGHFNVQWNALGPLLQELQHAVHLSKGSAVFRVGGSRVAGVSASSDGFSSAPLDEVATAAVQRAGHLRRVLLALPRPEPLPRLAAMFSSSAPVRSLMGPEGSFTDRLALALGRGLSTITSAELTDQVCLRGY
jgi:hypothetical protein